MIPDELIIRAAREFPGCIECSKDHLTSVTYFHTSDCKRGAGLSPEVLYSRIQERVAVLQARGPKVLWKVPTTRCSRCSQPATGTLWVRYHRHQHILCQDLVCEAHAQDDSDRESGYIPGKEFETIFDVEVYLNDLLRG